MVLRRKQGSQCEVEFENYFFGVQVIRAEIFYLLIQVYDHRTSVYSMCSFHSLLSLAVFGFHGDARAGVLSFGGVAVTVATPPFTLTAGDRRGELCTEKNNILTEYAHTHTHTHLHTSVHFTVLLLPFVHEG